MIVTVTPNPALDVTYTLDRLTPGRSHRVQQVVQRAGGKGVNVASVLTQLGYAATVLGPCGGTTGAELRHDLRDRGVLTALTDVEPPTRRTVTVVEADSTATVLNEPGRLSAHEWDEVAARVRTVLREPVEVLVASGSLPRGAPEDAYADLVAEARSAGVPCIVDTSGPPLLAAVAAGPDVVKPNQHELAEVTGTDDPAAGARELQGLGARTVVVSRGRDGVLVVTPDGASYAARPREPLQGNPTGAGDAAVAALAAGLLEQPWPDLVRTVVGWSSAAVLAPVAGMVDRAAVHDLTVSALGGEA
ncbi:1-phosphofructokinase family hexose kinase [Luteipulveratus flavus]|uniref:1-phosphofructokinase family hexose kinase n=1 Tax=Luteipulveratus flavus TaxID=3031728 RepID=A0ABT6C9B6_9MICO|nr:1-phosphofructokinase family hexose kinase [Luteipulveratus sp. YIM 133296]MDF8263891.1 1-phosphofructokinase family hexose kinase [Luteipulveratus sp. YIM 133296]